MTDWDPGFRDGLVAVCVRGVGWLIGLFKLVSLLCMLVLIAAGLWDVVRGIGAVMPWAQAPAADGTNAAACGPAATLRSALEGMELIFLAPLPFLVLRGVREFVDAAVDRQQHGRAHRDLLEVKGLVTSLMIAVIATSGVERTLAHDLELSHAAGICALILALVAYYVCLQRFGSDRRSANNGMAARAGEDR